MKWVLVALLINGNASPTVLRIDMASEAACGAAIKSLSAGMGERLAGATCISGTR